MIVLAPLDLVVDNGVSALPETAMNAAPSGAKAITDGTAKQAKETATKCEPARHDPPKSATKPGTSSAPRTHAKTRKFTHTKESEHSAKNTMKPVLSCRPLRRRHREARRRTGRLDLRE